MATLKSMRDQIKADLDLEDEDFIQDSDINTWLNDAIKVAESEIHTLYEDYFLDDVTVTLTSGQNLYDYPSDIYGNKVRKIIFREASAGSTSVHEIRRVRNLVDAKSRDIYNNNSNPILQWSPHNDATEGRKIRLYPEVARDGFMVVYYLRNAKQLVDDSDITDIDEFSRFLVQYGKTQAYLKDGDPRADDSKILEEQFKQEMILSLANMVPDNNNEFELDTSHYEDMVGSGYYDDDYYGDY